MDALEQLLLKSSFLETFSKLDRNTQIAMALNFSKLTPHLSVWARINLLSDNPELIKYATLEQQLERCTMHPKEYVPHLSKTSFNKAVEVYSFLREHRQAESQELSVTPPPSRYPIM